MKSRSFSGAHKFYLAVSYAKQYYFLEMSVNPLPTFPTQLHHNAALVVNNFFSELNNVDTVLLVNSCARGQAVADSDLDFAVLVKDGTRESEIKSIESDWLAFSSHEPTLNQYRNSNQFAHLHLDVIRRLHSHNSRNGWDCRLL